MSDSDNDASDYEEKRGGSVKVSSKEDRDASGPTRRRVSLSTCRRIAYFTQFVVVTCSLAIFLVVVYLCIYKHLHTNVLESKKEELFDKAWFKFAVCLRPFMTPSLMHLFYRHHKRYADISNYTSYLEALGEKDWKTTSWLDDHLRPEAFKYYFTHVHPWNKIRARELWDFRFVYFQRAFQEFKINKKKMETRKLPGMSDANDLDSGYTILKSSTIEGTEQPMLLGDYSFSPYYGGCLNITVLEKMNKRQMEINIKFRDHIEHESSEINTEDADTPTVDEPHISLFEAADLFVYDTNEHFSEFPVVHKFTKYSILSHSLERLLVKGSRYHRSVTAKHCVNSTGYSQTNCRHWCVMRNIFKAVPCMLPWMRNHLQKPWVDKTFKKKKQCSDHEEFIRALDIQREFLHPKASNKSKAGEVDCFNKNICPQGCNSYKVQLLSLGSKSIGSNYGISLTITPDVDTVTTHYDYQLLTMVAELSASISFLLGLSAIAIYDWIITLIVWLLIHLKIYKPPAGEDSDEDDTGSESEYGTKGNASDDEGE